MSLRERVVAWPPQGWQRKMRLSASQLPLSGPIARKRGDRIGRAARLVAAARRQAPATGPICQPRGDAGSAAARSSARPWPARLARSCAQAARNRARCRRSGRSGHGRRRRCRRSGRISRASARKRRFMRLRTTALPIFLVTVKPTRMRRIAVVRGRGRAGRSRASARAVPRVGREEIRRVCGG